MNEDVLKPADCTTMPEVRAGVDALDAELVFLLVRRFGYMDAAARIKPSREVVRDEARKAQVLSNVRTHAERHGLPADRIAAVWEVLIEQSIAYEFDSWDQVRVRS